MTSRLSRASGAIIEIGWIGLVTIQRIVSMNMLKALQHGLFDVVF